MLNSGFIRAWQTGEDGRVFPHLQMVHLSHGRGGLTQHARALNKSAFPPLTPHATPRHTTPRHAPIAQRAGSDSTLASPQLGVPRGARRRQGLARADPEAESPTGQSWSHC